MFSNQKMNKKFTKKIFINYCKLVKIWQLTEEINSSTKNVFILRSVRQSKLTRNTLNIFFKRNGKILREISQKIMKI